MIVDSSALLAVLLAEPDRRRYVEAMVDAPALAMTAANWFETAMVAEARAGARARQDFDDLIAEAGIAVAPVTHELARRACAAWQAWGKGNHPAGLNFGDCFAYALAQERGEPLLFKGDDFARTDITPAIGAAG